jgi:hypothetical protein
VYKMVVGKAEGKRPLGRPRRSWVDSVMIHLVQIGWVGADCAGLVQDRNNWKALATAVMNLRVP